MRDRLAEDLDTPAALALVDAWAAAALEGSGEQEEQAPAMVCDAVDALLGVALDPCADGTALQDGE
jgi:L-cysteine:1D-myo-inositol 2-amino-2-deoxy-alpha-D-glucopyranoside ligase